MDKPIRKRVVSLKPEKLLLGYCSIHTTVPAIVRSKSKDGVKRFCKECWEDYKRKELKLPESLFK